MYNINLPSTIKKMYISNKKQKSFIPYNFKNIVKLKIDKY